MTAGHLYSGKNTFYTMELTRAQSEQITFSVSFITTVASESWNNTENDRECNSTHGENDARKHQEHRLGSRACECDSHL
jgi:hypothetical protein